MAKRVEYGRGISYDAKENTAATAVLRRTNCRIGQV